MFVLWLILAYFRKILERSGKKSFHKAFTLKISGGYVRLYRTVRKKEILLAFMLHGFRVAVAVHLIFILKGRIDYGSIRKTETGAAGG